MKWTEDPNDESNFFCFPQDYNFWLNYSSYISAYIFYLKLLKQTQKDDNRDKINTGNRLSTSNCVS